MMTAFSVSTSRQSAFQNGLEVAGLGIRHGQSRHDAPLFGFAAKRWNTNPRNDAHYTVGNLYSNPSHIQTSNEFRLSKWREMIAHVVCSISAERPNPVMHSRVSFFGEALRSFNPRVFVPVSRWLRDAFAVTPRAQSVST